MNTNTHYRRVVTSLFWVIVIVSGIAGIKITDITSYEILMATPFLSYHWALSLVLLQMLIASLSFMVLYWALVRSAVAAIEKKKGIVIYKPSLTRGVIYSAIIPFIWGIIGFLIVVLVASSGMHDSM